MKQHTKGIVSQEAVILVQQYCQEIVEALIERCVAEHQEQNRLRKMHGLPGLKKIGMSEFLSLLHIVNKPKFDFIVEGEQANSVNTCLSKAGKKVNN